MSSLLFVSSDPALGDRVEKACAGHKLRCKVVATLSNAEQWLQMQNFTMLLLDARFETRGLLKLLELAWKLHPLMIGALIDETDILRGDIELRIHGAHVFSGSKAFSELGEILKIVAENRTIPGSFQILVVEDLDSPRDIISSYLESMGYGQVEGVRSVAEALTHLRENPSRYSCVLTDINMPEVQGYELVRAIRADKELAHLPVIVLTAYATTENLMESLRAGATGFLVKPPRKKNLREELEKAKRILFNRQNPRICPEGDVDMLEDAISRLSF